jgi:hypothetical protein
MLLSALYTLATITSAFGATICNGSPDLCQRRYSNVTFIGAHNSYAVGGNVADNQYKDVTAQLNDGIRTLQVQAHSASDGVRLCHGSCTFRDAGLIGDYLTKVAAWVGSHPNDGEFSFRCAVRCAMCDRVCWFWRWFLARMPSGCSILRLGSYRNCILHKGMRSGDVELRIDSVLLWSLASREHSVPRWC